MKIWIVQVYYEPRSCGCWIMRNAIDQADVYFLGYGYVQKNKFNNYMVYFGDQHESSLVREEIQYLRTIYPNDKFE